MKVTVSLAVVVASALVVSAEPSHSFIAAVLSRHGQDLQARAGVDPSTIVSSCQSSCTSIVNTLDVRSISFESIACHSVADHFLRRDSNMCLFVVSSYFVLLIGLLGCPGLRVYAEQLQCSWSLHKLP